VTVLLATHKMYDVFHFYSRGGGGSICMILFFNDFIFYIFSYFLLVLNLGRASLAAPW